MKEQIKEKLLVWGKWFWSFLGPKWLLVLFLLLCASMLHPLATITAGVIAFLYMHDQLDNAGQATKQWWGNRPGNENSVELHDSAGEKDSAGGDANN